jgi:hypothetical protein
MKLYIFEIKIFISIVFSINICNKETYKTDVLWDPSPESNHERGKKWIQSAQIKTGEITFNTKSSNIKNKSNSYITSTCIEIKKFLHRASSKTNKIIQTYSKIDIISQLLTNSKQLIKKINKNYLFFIFKLLENIQTKKTLLEDDQIVPKPKPMSKRKRTNENLNTPIKQKASKKQSFKNKYVSKSEALLPSQKITLEKKINKLETTLQIEKTKVDDIEAAINNTDNEKKLETLENKLKSTKNKIKNLKFNLIRNKNLFKINQQKITDQNTSSEFSTEKSTNTEIDQTEQTHNFKQTISTPKNTSES